MNPQWEAAWQAVIHHPLFGVAITLAAFQLSYAAYEKTRWVFLQPVLVSMLMVVGVLLVCGLGYEDYRLSAQMLTVMLGPATVALAVPLYLNLRRIRELFGPIMITLLIGGITATALGMALAWAFGADRMILMTLAPKSVTSPIAMLVADQIGGVVALAAVFVMITGILGAIFGPELLRRFGVQHPAPRHGAGPDRARGGYCPGPGGKRGVRRLRRAGDEPDGRANCRAVAAGGVPVVVKEPA